MSINHIFPITIAVIIFVFGAIYGYSSQYCHVDKDLPCVSTQCYRCDFYKNSTWMPNTTGWTQNYTTNSSVIYPDFRGEPFCEIEIKIIIEDFGKCGGNQTIVCYRCKDAGGDWYCPV